MVRLKPGEFDRWVLKIGPRAEEVVPFGGGAFVDTCLGKRGRGEDGVRLVGLRGRDSHDGVRARRGEACRIIHPLVILGVMLLVMVAVVSGGVMRERGLVLFEPALLPKGGEAGGDEAELGEARFLVVLVCMLVGMVLLVQMRNVIGLSMSLWKGALAAPRCQTVGQSAGGNGMHCNALETGVGRMTKNRAKRRPPRASKRAIQRYGPRSS